MKSSVFVFFAFIICFSTTSCNSVYQQNEDVKKCEISEEHMKGILPRKGKIKTYCKVEIQCGESCPGFDDSVFYTDIYHIPLQKIFEDVYEDASNKFLIPSADYRADSFTLRIEVQEVLIDVETDSFGDGGMATCTLKTLYRFYNPSDTRILVGNTKKTVTMPLDQNAKNEVFDAVYEAVIQTALETFKGIYDDKKCYKALKKHSIE